MGSEVQQGTCEVHLGIPQGLGQGYIGGPELLGYWPLHRSQMGHHCLVPLRFADPHHLCQVCHRVRHPTGLGLHWVVQRVWVSVGSLRASSIGTGWGIFWMIYVVFKVSWTEWACGTGDRGNGGVVGPRCVGEV